MSERRFQGIAAAEGIATGPAFIFHPPQLTIKRRTAEDPAAEMARFEAARETAEQELASIREQVRERTDAEHAAIFDAHIMLLNDPALQSSISDRLSKGASAEAAVQEATEEFAAMFAAMDNEMFAARAADLQDLGRRLVRVLLGIADTSLDALRTPSIVVATDLTPSDTASLEPGMALGLSTAAG